MMGAISNYRPKGSNSKFNKVLSFLPAFFLLLLVLLLAVLFRARARARLRARWRTDSNLELLA
jgi:MFS superfamily sulfate permease-like transporter